MEYAVVKIGGSQYKLVEGDEIDVPKLKAAVGDEKQFPQVLLWRNGDHIEVGQPLVTGVIVTGKVVSQLRGDKIRVATYKAKSRYRKVKGHRDYLTRVKIEAIVSQDSPKQQIAQDKNGQDQTRRKNQTTSKSSR